MHAGAATAATHWHQLVNQLVTLPASKLLDHLLALAPGGVPGSTPPPGSGQPVPGFSPPVQGSIPPVQGSSPPVQCSTPLVQGSTPAVQSGGDGAGMDAETGMPIPPPEEAGKQEEASAEKVSVPPRPLHEQAGKQEEASVEKASVEEASVTSQMSAEGRLAME